MNSNYHIFVKNIYLLYNYNFLQLNKIEAIYLSSLLCHSLMLWRRGLNCLNVTSVIPLNLYYVNTGRTGKGDCFLKGKKVSPRACFKGWMGRKGNKNTGASWGTLILAKTQASDDRQVKNENLNIKYT